MPSRLFSTGYINKCDEEDSLYQAQFWLLMMTFAVYNVGGLYATYNEPFHKLYKHLFYYYLSPERVQAYQKRTLDQKSLSVVYLLFCVFASAVVLYIFCPDIYVWVSWVFMLILKVLALTILTHDFLLLLPNDSSDFFRVFSLVAFVTASLAIGICYVPFIFEGGSTYHTLYEDLLAFFVCTFLIGSVYLNTFKSISILFLMCWPFSWNSVIKVEPGIVSEKMPMTAFALNICDETDDNAVKFLVFYYKDVVLLGVLISFLLRFVKHSKNWWTLTYPALVMAIYLTYAGLVLRHGGIFTDKFESHLLAIIWVGVTIIACCRQEFRLLWGGYLQSKDDRLRTARQENAREQEQPLNL